MPPHGVHLSHWQRAKMEMLLHQGLNTADIAKASNCSIKTVKNNRRKWRVTGSLDVKASFLCCQAGVDTLPRGGQRRRTLWFWLLADGQFCTQKIKEFLTFKPESDLQEICDFLYWAHDLDISRSTASRHVKAMGWSNEKMRLIAAQRNEPLRAAWMEALQQYRPDQLVYVDESGCDKRDGARRYGWAPLGSTLELRARLERGQRYHLLPALTVDGLLDTFVYPGQPCLDGFVSWVRDRVLPKCTRFPGPRSVLVLDNALWHHSQQLQDLCDEASVELLYLPLYSPDFNPIEALKANHRSRLLSLRCIVKAATTQIL